MRKRRKRSQRHVWAVAAMGAVAAVLVAHAFLPEDFPRNLLVGATDVLSVNVLPAPSSGGGGGTTPPSRGGGGGGGGNTPPTITPEKPSGLCSAKPDVNADSRVDLADFSILAYWFKKPLSDSAKMQVDLNCDGKVDLVDFSIMAYYWKKR